MTRPPGHNLALTLDQTLQEGLRALFILGAEALQLEGRDGTRALFAKEHLIVLLERGLGEESLESIIHHTAWHHPYQEVQKNLAPGARVLCLDAEGKGEVCSTLDLTELHSKDVPSWWTIPLPLLALQDDGVRLNPRGEMLCGPGIPSVDDVRSALARDHLMDCTQHDPIKTILLVPLAEDIYLLEDVSSDMALAEDVAWWAAAGQALVAYFEGQGYRIHQWRGTPPPRDVTTGETVACQWDGRLLGHITLEIVSKPLQRRISRGSGIPANPSQDTPLFQDRSKPVLPRKGEL